MTKKSEATQKLPGDAPGTPKGLPRDLKVAPRISQAEPEATPRRNPKSPRGAPWGLHVTHGDPWDPRRLHGDTMGTPWGPMGAMGGAWGPMGTHEGRVRGRGASLLPSTALTINPYPFELIPQAEHPWPCPCWLTIGSSLASFTTCYPGKSEGL